MKLCSKIVISGVIFTLLVTAIIPSYSNASETINVNIPEEMEANESLADQPISEKELQEAENEPLTVEEEKEFADLEKSLSTIESIPDSTLEQGPQSVVDWANGQQSIRVKRGIIGCTSAVIYAIATTAIPLAKITKIKSALKAAGGATKFVKVLISKYKYFKKKGHSKKSAIKQAIKIAAGKASKDVKEAIIELSGLGAVYGACFE